ncbi:hypothetical protein B0J14DRAFT_569966 [Halenospora varia]|nr:hypothetical protein B0J14DRAFT_569966 [Halenospora varia]
MSSSKQLGQPKKDVKKLLDTEEKEEEDDEDDMLTEDRDNAKKIKDGKADKKMKIWIIKLRSPENGTTTVGSNASGSGTSGPGGEISLTASGHSATSATSNDKPEAPTTSSLFVGSDEPSSNSQQGHTSGPPLSKFGNPIPNLFPSPPPNPIPNPLATPPFANPPAGPPVINLVDEEGAPQAPATDEDPDDDDAGLFTPEQNKVVTGRSDDGAVVAWRQQGYSKQVVVRYGPKNSPRYERSTKAKAGIPFDEKTTPQTGPDHRFGDEKIGRKFVRQWNDFKGVLGVAYNCPLKDLMPRKVSGKKTYPRLEIWVKWTIDGKIHRVWEVPSSIKHIWPNPTQCEEYLYNVACDHDKKHRAWQSGQREGREASPSPGPEMDRLMPTGPQVTIKPEVHESSGIPPTKTERERMFEYKNMWCELKAIDSENLTTQQEFMFLNV